ncbi:MAG TPA: hypothetical protein VGL24_13565 [Chthoniobacterales bacterium]|jgi:hypothetical protein
MKKPTIHRRRRTLALLSFLCVFAATSAWATVVTWSLNPNSTEGAVGTTSQTFTSSGYSITASGYTVGWPNTPLGLYYKTTGADLPGLGITSTSDHQLQGNGWYPTSFIQIDVTSLLAQGFTDGKLQIGNVYNSDSFVIWGSSALGDPGQQIGGTYTSSSNLSFISIADFANYGYISIGAINGGVLPVAFQATLSAVPEMSALFPIVGLIVAIAITQILRRRRIAQLRAGSPGAH